MRTSFMLIDGSSSSTYWTNWYSKLSIMDASICEEDALQSTHIDIQKYVNLVSNVSWILTVGKLEIGRGCDHQQQRSVHPLFCHHNRSAAKISGVSFCCAPPICTQDERNHAFSTQLSCTTCDFKWHPGDGIPKSLYSFLWKSR